MKRLVCEMCGSTDMVKDGGLFVCQACGCKYTVEEAKKMMLEGTVEVQGIVSIERKNEVENRMTNAINEFKTGNYDVSYTLFSEILNIEPDNERAILYKALCDGWKSSISTPKLPSASNEICRAIKINAGKIDPNISYNQFCSEVLIETEKVGKAMFRSLDEYKASQQERYKKLTAESDRKSAEAKMSQKTNIYLAQSQGQAALDYFTRAVKLRQDTDNTYASGLVVTEEPLVSIAKTIVDNIPDSHDVESGLLMAMEEYMSVIEAYPTAGEIETNIKAIKNFFRDIKQQVIEREEKEKAKRIEDYWKEHQTEKDQFVRELEDIETKIDKLQKELTKIAGENESKIKVLQKEKRDQDVPALKELNQTGDLIRELQNRRANLGLFKSKEKKALSEQINREESKLEQIREEVDRQKKELNTRIDNELQEIENQIKPIKNEMNNLINRKQEISIEFTKDRQS